jgi:hypothetical protein
MKVPSPLIAQNSSPLLGRGVRGEDFSKREVGLLIVINPIRNLMLKTGKFIFLAGLPVVEDAKCLRIKTKLQQIIGINKIIDHLLNATGSKLFGSVNIENKGHSKNVLEETIYKLIIIITKAQELVLILFGLVQGTLVLFAPTDHLNGKLNAIIIDLGIVLVLGMH